MESGNEAVRRNLLNRNIPNQLTENIFSLCRRMGIQTMSFNLVGLPMETKQEMLDTVLLNAACRPATMQVSIFYPFPKTKLAEYCQEHGFVHDLRIKNYFSEVACRYPGISRHEILFVFHYFRIFVRLFEISFELPKPLSEWGNRLIRRLFLCGPASSRVGVILAPVILFFTPEGRFLSLLKRHCRPLYQALRRLIRKI